MAENLSPFVYWGQNNDTIFLKVDIKEVSNPEVQLDEDGIRFRANGLGVQGRHDYSFDLAFYLPIEHEKSKYRVGDRFTEFQLRKVGIGECWPRLTYDQKKPAWLKIDFDHFSYDDSEEEKMTEQEEKEEESRLMERLEKDLKEAEASAFSDMKSFYLFVYNMFMLVGYGYVFIVMSIRYMLHGEASKAGVFAAVGPQLMVCQLAAVLEVVHACFGLVKSAPLMPLMQVFGRNLILFGLIAAEEKLQDRQVVWWLFLAWSAVEIIRYPYYMLHIVHMEWQIVTWLRYTVWIPLYPLGFMCEGFIMLLALPLFDQSGKWTLSLPNSFNVAFHFPTFIRIYMVAALFGMYMLMQRMYQQRKKIIPPGPQKSIKTHPREKAKTA